MVGAIAGALQAAPAALGMIFGENNIFSGKGRQASREAENAFRASQNMGIGQGFYDYLGAKQAQANRGLGASTLGLMERNAGRSTNAAISALGNSRNLLRGIGAVAQAGQDAAMNLGVANEQALSRNRDEYNQAQLQISDLEFKNALRKNEEAQNYWANRKAESNQAISSGLSAIGSGIATGLTMGAMNKQTKALSGLGDLFNAGAKSKSWGNVLGDVAGFVANSGLAKRTQTPYMNPSYNRLPAFSQQAMMGGQYSVLSKPKSNLIFTPKYGGY